MKTDRTQKEFTIDTRLRITTKQQQNYEIEQQKMTSKKQIQRRNQD